MLVHDLACPEELDIVSTCLMDSLDACEALFLTWCLAFTGETSQTSLGSIESYFL